MQEQNLKQKCLMVALAVLIGMPVFAGAQSKNQREQQQFERQRQKQQLQRRDANNRQVNRNLQQQRYNATRPYTPPRPPSQNNYKRR
jgi:cell division protein FtsB